MLSGLRAGAPIYVLYKNDLRVATGEVVSVSNPVPQFGTNYVSGVLSPPKSTVDVRVRFGTEVADFQKLPADQSIADFGSSGIVVSESRDAILNEIDAFKKVSERAISEVPHHRKIIDACNLMLTELNPQLKREAEQSAEISELRNSVAALQTGLSEIKTILAKALPAQKGKSAPASD